MLVFDEARPFYDALRAALKNLSDEDNAAKATAQFWPAKIRHALRAQTESALQEALKFEENQLGAQEIFESTTRELIERVDELSELSDMSLTTEFAKRVEQLDAELRNATQHAVVFNRREGVFGKKATDYSNIRATRDAFDPFHKFWTYARDWQVNRTSWWNTPFYGLDATHMDATVSDAFKVMFKMGKAFTTRKLPLQVKNCESIRNEVGGANFPKSTQRLFVLRIVRP